MPSNIFHIHDDLTFYDKRDNDVAAAAAAAVFVILASWLLCEWWNDMEIQYHRDKGRYEVG